MENIKAGEKEMALAEKKPVGAVASALDVLRYLARLGRPCRLTDISRATELLPSTCLAILRTLAEKGFVMRDDGTKTYTLGYGALDLARSLLRSDLTIQFILPQLQEVSDRYDVTTTVWRRVDDADIMFVSVVTGARALRLEVDFGCRAPLMNAAIGRLMATQSGLDRDEVARRFAEIPWSSDIDFARFSGEAEEARLKGWAIDKGDYNPRLLSIAVASPSSLPIIDRGVTATMFVDQHSEDSVIQIARDLQEIAAKLRHV
jgi:DNA-binding IclR family transcriptional regulator